MHLSAWRVRRCRGAKTKYKGSTRLRCALSRGQRHGNRRKGEERSSRSISSRSKGSAFGTVEGLINSAVFVQPLVPLRQSASLAVNEFGIVVAEETSS